MIQTTIIILSQDTQERIDQESLLRQISFSASLSIVLLSNSLPHSVFFSLPLSYCFILSLSLSFSFSFSFLFVYAWTHTVLCCTVLYWQNRMTTVELFQFANNITEQSRRQNYQCEPTSSFWELDTEFPQANHKWTDTYLPLVMYLPTKRCSTSHPHLLFG